MTTTITASTVQASIAATIAKKSSLPKWQAAIVERKVDQALRALMRGQVLNAAVAADEAAASAA